ncbi:MAG: fused heptose 7-phosphate kinase/heptose 1-phosphate adenyltransferase [Candidatus Westeberhardia cardiocondylae]|nr:fused heptose 7-phosphate kinase/heptose 1-phosphate adenyltransferase [Candidatus Westeberhardia cardiocondylae]
MEIILPNFCQARILVVGDVMLDRYWCGTIMSDRKFLESSIPIVKINSVVECPGGAANVAMYAASLGSNVFLSGITGMDEGAKVLEKKLHLNNVFCNFIKMSGYGTILKLRVVSGKKKIVRLDFESNIDNLGIFSDLLDRVNLLIAKVSVLVLSDYAKGTLRNVQEMILLGKKFGIPVLVDPKGKDFFRYKGATLLTPNLLEFESVMGVCKDEKDLVDCGMRLMYDCDLSALLITRASQGMSLLQIGKDPVHFPAYSSDVCDDTGAGDIVISVLAASLASGNDLESSCFLGNVFAGMQIRKTRVFAHSVCENADMDYYRKKGINFGVIQVGELKKVVQIVHEYCETVVMVNFNNLSEFDYEVFFANAKKLGDRLIVVVRGGSFTKEINKNYGCFESLEQCRLFLLSVKIVDWIVFYHDDILHGLIANIVPDFFVWEQGVVV